MISLHMEYCFSYRLHIRAYPSTFHHSFIHPSLRSSYLSATPPPTTSLCATYSRLNHHLPSNFHHRPLLTAAIHLLLPQNANVFLPSNSVALPTLAPALPRMNGAAVEELGRTKKPHKRLTHDQIQITVIEIPVLNQACNISVQYRVI